MFRTDRHGGIFLAKFKQHQSSIRLQRVADAFQHALRARELVVDVDKHNQVELARREPRIGFRTEDRFDVADVPSRCFRAQPFQHAGLNIIGVNHASRRDALRNAKAIETGACAYIPDEHAGPQVKSGDGFRGLLLPLPLLAIQPICPAEAHDRRDAASGDRMDGLREGVSVRGKKDRQGTHGIDHYGAAAAALHFLRFRFPRREFDSKKNTVVDGQFHRNVRARSRVSSALAMGTLLLAFPFFCRAADSTLAIVDAGVQQAEDAPFVNPGFRFLPGDYLYFTFQIAGFSIRSEQRNEVRKISLSYELALEDAKGVPLTPPASGDIQAELNPEDKHWTPKRRVSFLIPSFIAAGDFHVHVTVKDLLGKSETSEDIPFHIGGMEVQSANAITLQDFRFLRGENDGQPLEVAAYSPGDTVYVKFEIVGFKTGPRNEYNLSYGIQVLGPDGKPFVDQPKAAELADSSFYPAQYLPGDLTVTTSATSSRGGYVLIVTVRDLIAKTSYQAKKVFSLE